MKPAFDQAFEYTVGNEGKYSNHPNDRGGPTKYGITKSDLSRWLHQPVSPNDVKEMSLDTAKEIYEAWYWKALGCQGIINTGIAVCMFDIGVVRGIGVPPRYAQQICNAHGTHLVVDGHIGPLTLNAINETDPGAFIRDFSAKAEAGFRSIATKPGQSVFLKGWVNRARRLLTLIA